MYSPKIREELIPKVYRAAKGAAVPMTVWVNRLIEQALAINSGENDPETKDGSDRKEKRE